MILDEIVFKQVSHHIHISFSMEFWADYTDPKERVIVGSNELETNHDQQITLHDT